MKAKIIVLISWLALATAGHAETIGVVMMHGKHGTPAQFDALASAVEAAGFPVERPDMCWSRSRIYDRAYLDCFADADSAVTALKARGADTVVILGMSLGGNAALGYGAHRPGLKGVIAIAPASDPERIRRRPAVARSIAMAEGLIAAGKGDEKRTFTDLNNGDELQVTATSAVFLSFVGKQSPAVMPVNAAHLTAPLLIVSGTDDRTQDEIGAVFARAPHDPKNARVMVHSDHTGTPNASITAVIAWLKSLSR